MSKARAATLPTPVQTNQRMLVGPATWAEVYHMGECQILVSVEVIDGSQELHLSISHSRRYPTWDEIFAARYHLMPEQAEVAMFLPAPAEYVNVHQFCFHMSCDPDAARKWRLFHPLLVR